MADTRPLSFYHWGNLRSDLRQHSPVFSDMFQVSLRLLHRIKPSVPFRGSIRVLNINSWHVFRGSFRTDLYRFPIPGCPMRHRYPMTEAVERPFTAGPIIPGFPMTGMPDPLIMTRYRYRQGCRRGYQCRFWYWSNFGGVICSDDMPDKEDPLMLFVCNAEILTFLFPGHPVLQTCSIIPSVDIYRE